MVNDSDNDDYDYNDDVYHINNKSNYDDDDGNIYDW